MGKYRDHREPRRRGIDENHSGEAPEPSYFQRDTTRPKVPSSSPLVNVEVAWFNAEKGFGFVKLDDGSDAFLHVRALESAGYGAVSQGMRLTVRIGEGQKGLQVTEVLEVSGEVSSGPDRPSQPARLDRDHAEHEGAGTVKWYDVGKGFGFIGLEEGTKDVFVHASALKRSGIEILEEGQRVVVRWAQGQKGPEARSIRLA